MLNSEEEENCTESFPSFPFLVVIKITPLAALLPYNAAAEGPLKTERQEYGIARTILESGDGRLFVPSW